MGIITFLRIIYKKRLKWTLFQVIHFQFKKCSHRRNIFLVHSCKISLLHTWELIFVYNSSCESKQSIANEKLQILCNLWYLFCTTGIYKKITYMKIELLKYLLAFNFQNGNILFIWKKFSSWYFTFLYLIYCFIVNKYLGQCSLTMIDPCKSRYLK